MHILYHDDHPSPDIKRPGTLLKVFAGAFFAATPVRKPVAGKEANQ